MSSWPLGLAAARRQLAGNNVLAGLPREAAARREGGHARLSFSSRHFWAARRCPGGNLVCSRPPGVTPHHPCGPLQCQSASDISVPRTAGRSSPHLQPSALHHAGWESCVLLQGVADQRQLAQTAQRADLSRQALYAALLQVQVDQAGQPADLQAQTADICRCIRLPPALQGCSSTGSAGRLSTTTPGGTACPGVPGTTTAM